MLFLAVFRDEGKLGVGLSTLQTVHPEQPENGLGASVRATRSCMVRCVGL